MKAITLTEEELKKLKQLIREIDSYYEFDDQFNNRTEDWDFEDVNAQREIAVDIVNILRDKI